MSDLERILSECTEFEWDEGNATKNWVKHDVAQSECEEIFFNRPLLVKLDEDHSLTETRYYALGKTDGNRLLTIVFTIRIDRIRVISARDMTERERRRYLS